MTLTILVILLIFCEQTNSYSIDLSHQVEQDAEGNLIPLLLRLKNEEFFDNVLIYGEDCIFHTLSKYMEFTAVLVSSGSTNYDWNFSSLTLILICGSDDDKEHNYRTLMKLQRSRRLVINNNNSQMEDICNNYSIKEQYNIAILREDFNPPKTIYSCRYFPNSTVEEISLSAGKPIYIEQLRNMHRKSIRAMTDGLAPRSLVYYDEKSKKLRVLGYVAMQIINFAKRVNATLKMATLGNHTDILIIKKLVVEGQLDFGIVPETSLFIKHFDGTSYPWALSSYCLMMPVPEKIPYNMVYVMIVDRMVIGIIFVLFGLLTMLLIFSRSFYRQDLSLANVLLNDKSFRGLLGQTFPFPDNAGNKMRLVFVILCFAGIMFTTMYNAYLNSYFTSPPYGPHVTSFGELEKFKQKVAFSAVEMNLLATLNSSRYKKIHDTDKIILPDWKQFLSLRDSFNTSYGYPVTEDRWDLYEEQQKLFKVPSFYYAKDLCFTHMLFLSIPLRPLVPYRHLFEEHILSQREFGLVSYWRSRSFLDMVTLKLAPLKDLSQPKPFSPSLLMDDISWVMKAYLGGMLLSFLIFLLELGGRKCSWTRLRVLEK
ncbi:hypothetical protein KR074_003926 [Drosophila pseudoananassae]|nr:hypothetical protein KR074_003926 [Drosophila pseudoananassae]